MKRILQYVVLLACVSFGLTAFPGCENDEGPAEEAGEAIDEAGEEAEDELDDATDE